MHDEGVFVGAGDEGFVDLVAGEIRDALLGFGFHAHGDPDIGVQNIRALGGSVGIFGDDDVAAGASDELDGCSVEVAAYVNDVPQHVLRLFSGTQTWSIGAGLTVVELEHPEKGCAVDVFLYDQGSFEGSLGVYGNQRGDKDVAELEDVRYSPHAMGAIGMRGEIFFHVTGDSATPAVEEMTQRVVEALAQTGQEDVIPPGFKRLHEDLGVPFAQIGYQAVNAFQYRFAESFWFGKPDAASDERLFIHEAESADAAEALFDRLHDELLSDYKAVSSEAGELLLQHNFLDTFFCLMREGEMVFGVERASAQEDAALAMARLQESFADEAGEEGGYYADGEGGEY